MNLLRGAFGVLAESDGRAYWRDVERVTAAVREHGDAASLSLLRAAGDDFPGPAWRELVALADAAGAGGLVALDMVTEYANPGCHSHLGRRSRERLTACEN